MGAHEGHGLSTEIAGKRRNVAVNHGDIWPHKGKLQNYPTGRLRLKCDGTRAETRFRLSPKRTSPFKSAGALVQSTAGSRGVRISGSNAGYTTFRGSVRVLATHSIRQFHLRFPSRTSPCAIRFQTNSSKFSSTGPPLCI